MKTLLDSSAKRKRVARSESPLEDGEKPSKPNKSVKASSVTEMTTASSATQAKPSLQPPPSKVFVLVHIVRGPYQETEIDVSAAFDSADKANRAARALFEQEHPEWARGPDGEENESHVDDGGSPGDGNYTYETFDEHGAVKIVGQDAEGERIEVYVKKLTVNENLKVMSHPRENPTRRTSNETYYMNSSEFI